MKNNVNYDAIFKESESYPEMLLSVTLKGGNKAKMNKFIQTQWMINKDKRTATFVRQGYEMGEIPLRFIWNMLGCTEGLCPAKKLPKKK